MIQCEKVSKRYAKNIALNDLSFSMKDGEVLGLLGVNGAGKSTLIKIILGFLRPDSGKMMVNATSLGYMPEIASMPETVSPLSFVRFALKLRQSNMINAESCLREIKLAESAWKKPIRQLSKGMRQRTGLAFSLAGNPKLLVLDEPMSGLDAVGRVHLINLLQQRQQEGATILICSHIVPDLVRLTKRVLLMGGGQILESFDIQKHDLHEVELLEKALTQGHAI